MKMSDYAGNSLAEKPAIDVLQRLGHETRNCFRERVGDEASDLVRELPPT